MQIKHNSFSLMDPNCQVAGLKSNHTETQVRMQHVLLHPAAFVTKISSGVGDRLEKNITTAHADRDARRHTHTHTHTRARTRLLRKQQLTKAEIYSISKPEGLCENKVKMLKCLKHINMLWSSNNPFKWKDSI